MMFHGALKTKSIISTQYFLFFGALGVFLPYFNLYCYHLGFSGFQIGLISSARSITLVVFPFLWSILADRYRMRRSIYIFCLVTSTAVWAFYLFTDQFVPMLVITICYGIFFSPIISFLEAITMDLLGREKMRYGSIRAWGSISFIITVLVMGKAIDRSSVNIIIACILAAFAVQSLSSFALPVPAANKKIIALSQAKIFFNRRVLLFLICAFLMLVSHGTYYGFFSIHLESLGYDKTFIGLSWALASTAEILVMIKSEKIFKRFSLDHVILFSIFVGALRWFALYSSNSTLVILVTQISHAVTYGTFHMASILYIDRLAPEEAKTLGQAINNSLTYGLGLMVGFFLNGWLFDILGSNTLFFISGAIGVSAGVMFTASTRRRHETNP
ncbi:MAG: MFS transporter [Deltaproteobacteria bacterium]|nr:MFS transporter [Deltaproteobacteria bacterium]